MSSGLLKAVKISTDTSNAVSKILLEGHQDALDRDSDGIKQKIVASYDSFSRMGGFWNWGMHDAVTHRKISEEIPNFDQYEFDGCSEQMYFYTLGKIPWPAGQARKVLEVGSGAGAGLNFLSRFEGGSKFVGLDLSQKAVDRANGMYARPGSLEFLQGDAEHLPFQDGEFDAVINIESSHNYPNLGKFFSEVARVLRPGGHFSHIDIFTDHRRATMEQCKLQTKNELTWLEENDVTDYVKAAIRKRMAPDSIFLKRLKAGLPLPARPLAKFIFGSSFAKEERKQADSVIAKLLQRRDTRPNLRASIKSYRQTLARKVQ